MAEDQFSEQIVPGTFIRVQAEGLIAAGGISAGNVGIVGTASKNTGKTHTLSDYAGALETLGPYDDYNDGAGTLNLTRAVQILYANGARTVYAHALPAGADQAAFETGFSELLKDNVNILIAPELETATASTVLGAQVSNAEGNGKDLIGVYGSSETVVANIVPQVVSNKRLIMTAPGIVSYDSAAKSKANLSGTYAAAALAGLISSLAVQSSPTNKVLSGVGTLTQRFSYGETVDLLNGGVCPLEVRRGIRAVRGLTTQASENGPFSQITTRRIIDFAKAGIRQVSNPFIGRLNNQRVRMALRGAVDGFLTTMVQDESLTGYSLEVTATRQDEIAGRTIVNVAMQPTFSIDYIRVTLALS